MFSIKFTSPVIFFPKFLASEKLRKNPWKISPDFQNTMPNIGLRKIIKQNWVKNLNWHFCRTNVEYGWLQSLLGKKEFLVEMTQVYEGFKVRVHNSCGELSLEQFFCVGLGSMFYLLCLDSCLQTYVLRKIKTARFMLCLS